MGSIPTLYKEVHPFTAVKVKFGGERGGGVGYGRLYTWSLYLDTWCSGWH